MRKKAKTSKAIVVDEKGKQNSEAARSNEAETDKRKAMSTMAGEKKKSKQRTRGTRGGKKKDDKEAKAKRTRCERPQDDEVVEAVTFNQALTGNVRCYLLAKLTSGKKAHLIQLAPSDSKKYYSLTRKLEEEARKRVTKSPTLRNLKQWAIDRRKELLG